MSLSWFIGGPLLYLAVIVFLVKTVSTVLKYLNMPRHLRWDLYPVAHQGPEGSKYQKVDFGNLPPHISLFHELKEMSQEMLFIKKAYVNNPKVWQGSFPLHAGLYLGIIWLVLLLAGAIVELSGGKVAADSSIVPMIIYYATIVTGGIGFVAGLWGSLVLLWLRVTDEAMQDMSDFVSYLNLGVMICLFGTGVAAWQLADPAFAIMRQHTIHLLTLHPVAVSQPLVVLQMLAFCVFMIYLPFSRMAHFVAKYFFYHNIMWDDEMMKRNSPMEKDIATYLHYNMTWSAPHIRKNGTWLDQVMSGPPQDGEKK